MKKQTPTLVKFPADLKYLPEMISTVRTFCEDKNFSSQHLHKLELASEEVLVNIISYAYPEKKGEESLQIECVEREDGCEISFIDSGIPFNPLEFEAKPIENQSVDQLRIGGLGILLIRKLASEISYSREKNQNILKIVYLLS